MFGRQKVAKLQAPKSQPKELDSGGWVDLAECERLWSSRDGETLWRTLSGALVMRWAQRYATVSSAGVTIMTQVLEWRMDEVTQEFARDLMLKRGSEFATSHTGEAAKRLFPEPPKVWDPHDKR